MTAGSDRGIALYDLRSGELVGDLSSASTTLGNHLPLHATRDAGIVLPKQRLRAVSMLSA